MQDDAGTRFRFGFAFKRLNLAGEIYSLPRFSKRTLGLCSLQHPNNLAIAQFPEGHTFRALTGYNLQVSGSFHLLSRMLFSFPSRYSCAIGPKKCLELEVDTPIFSEHFQALILLTPSKSLKASLTGLSPSTAPLSRGLQLAS